MKKILYFLTMAVAMTVMAACSSNSPSSTAKDFMAAFQKQDFEAMVQLLCNKQGEQFSADEQAQLVSLFNLSKSKLDKIESYKVLGETIEDDGTRATVQTEVTVEGKEPVTDDLNMMKCDDGQWRIVFAK